MNHPLFSVPRFFDLTHCDHRQLFDGCGDVWEVLTKLSEYVRSLSKGTLRVDQYPHVYFEHPEEISIGPGTIIEAGAYIRGPCVIGRDCQIRHGAYIRGEVLIGDRCVVGHTTEVKHAVFLNHAKAAHFAFVGDSILGNDVNLGAGVKCANLRFDGKPVVVHTPNERRSSGLRKFGSVVGDGCQIGCNVVLNPGTLLGKYATCYPSLNIGGVIEDRGVVKPRL
jgi:NDP-sugar pyrophosphorylase family protein